MPKPKSQKKESDGTDLKKADLSLNDEKNETKKEGLKIEKPRSVNRTKELKNKLNSFLLISLSGLATASFGLLGVFLINNYYPNFFKNKGRSKIKRASLNCPRAIVPVGFSIPIFTKNGFVC